MKSLRKWHTSHWQCPWWGRGRGQKSQTYEEREILDFCINLLFWQTVPEQWWGQSEAKSQLVPAPKQVWQLTLCTEHLKIAMFVSWPSIELSNLDTNISSDLIPVNSGHEVNWNGIHLRSLLHMRLEGWLSRCQVRIWKHGFSQNLVLPRNIS